MKLSAEEAGISPSSCGSEREVVEPPISRLSMGVGERDRASLLPTDTSD